MAHIRRPTKTLVYLAASGASFSSSQKRYVVGRDVMRKQYHVVARWLTAAVRKSNQSYLQKGSNTHEINNLIPRADVQHQSVWLSEE